MLRPARLFSLPFSVPSRSLQLARHVYLSSCPPRVTLPVSPFPSRVPLLVASVSFPFSLRSLSLPPSPLLRVQCNANALRRSRARGDTRTQLCSASLRPRLARRHWAMRSRTTVGNTEATRERECSFIGAPSLSRGRGCRSSLPVVRVVRNFRPSAIRGLGGGCETNESGPPFYAAPGRPRGREPIVFAASRKRIFYAYHSLSRRRYRLPRILFSFRERKSRAGSLSLFLSLLFGSPRTR